MKGIKGQDALQSFQRCRNVQISETAVTPNASSVSNQQTSQVGLASVRLQIPRLLSLILT